MVQPTHELYGARGVVVSHPLSMREALGSIPSVSSSVSVLLFSCWGEAGLPRQRKWQRQAGPLRPANAPVSLPIALVGGLAGCWPTCTVRRCCCCRSALCPIPVAGISCRGSCFTTQPTDNMCGDTAPAQMSNWHAAREAWCGSWLWRSQPMSSTGHVV